MCIANWANIWLLLLCIWFDASQMPFSSSVEPTYCLHSPQRGVLKQISPLSLTDTGIVSVNVVHSLVMVVPPWYVNVHLCPPSVVTLIVFFAHSVDPLKQSKWWVLRWNCCEPQFTGPVFISIIQSNCFSDQWISVFGGYFITTFILCTGWLI